MEGQCQDGGTVLRWRDSVKMEGQCQDGGTVSRWRDNYLFTKKCITADNILLVLLLHKYIDPGLLTVVCLRTQRSGRWTSLFLAGCILNI